MVIVTRDGPLGARGAIGPTSLLGIPIVGLILSAYTAWCIYWILRHVSNPWKGLCGIGLIYLAGLALYYSLRRYVGGLHPLTFTMCFLWGSVYLVHTFTNPAAE